MTGGTPTLMLLGHRTAPRSPTRCDCRATDPASPSPDDLRIGPQPNRARAQEPRADHTSGVLALASACFPSRELITRTCLFVAHLRPRSMSTVWALSGVKRTKLRRGKIDVHDPYATSASNSPRACMKASGSHQLNAREIICSKCGAVNLSNRPERYRAWISSGDR